jgi:hypothetical protein
MALVRRTAEATGGGEYDIRVGIDFTGDRPLAISTIDNFGYHYDGASVPLHRYTPVEFTVNAMVSYSAASCAIAAAPSGATAIMNRKWSGGEAGTPCRTAWTRSGCEWINLGASAVIPARAERMNLL